MRGGSNESDFLGFHGFRAPAAANCLIRTCTLGAIPKRTPIFSEGSRISPARDSTTRGRVYCAPAEQASLCPVHFARGAQWSVECKEYSQSPLWQRLLYSPCKLRPLKTSPQGQMQHSMRAQVRGRLEQDGFTNIRIMPEAFLVRATDPDGNPVVMIVNADPLTVKMSNDQENANSEEQEGQTTSNPGSSTSPGEANPNASGSTKMSRGPSQAKIPGRPNGMVAELKQDETQQPLTLTNSQRVAIWRMLSNQASSTGIKQLHVGQVVPNGLSLELLPNSVSSQVPAVKPYYYVMLNNQLLIVDPSTKKIAAIIAD